MKTTVILEFDHSKPIPDLANFAAQRAYTLPGVDNVTVVAERPRLIGENLQARMEMLEKRVGLIELNNNAQSHRNVVIGQAAAW